MRKANKKMFEAIVSTMREDIAKYDDAVQNIYSEDGKISLMHYTDVKYAYDILLKFMLDKDTQQLYNALMWQDTIVREAYYKTLRCIYELDNERSVL